MAFNATSPSGAEIEPHRAATVKHGSRRQNAAIIRTGRRTPCADRSQACIAALLLAVSAAPAAADDFYAGKQISLIVGAGVGGGYDLQARVVARHLGRHIPGNPSVIVQNMPSRIAAANHMFTTAPRTAPRSRCSSAACCSPS